MGQKYLLPCACGQKQVIDRNDAGQTVRCACGQPLEAPTLLRMGSLEPVPETPADRARSSKSSGSRWGLRQALLTFGSIVLLVAALLAAWFHVSTPKRIPMEAFGPVDTLVAWESLRLGIAGDPSDRSPDLLRVLNRAYKWKMAFAAAVGVVGLLGLCVGLLVPRKPAAASSSPKGSTT